MNNELVFFESKSLKNDPQKRKSEALTPAFGNNDQLYSTEDFFIIICRRAEVYAFADLQIDHSISMIT
jgi:hypothetical protein